MKIFLLLVKSLYFIFQMIPFDRRWVVLFVVIGMSHFLSLFNFDILSVSTEKKAIRQSLFVVSALNCTR